MPVCSDCATQLFSPRIDLDLSVLRGKLRSDSGPFVSQPAEISTTLRNVQQDLTSCEDEIQRLEIRRAYLVEQRSLLQVYRDHLQAFSSPVRKLPNEILQRIFDDCCDMNYFRVGGRQHSYMQSEPALTLSSVSAQWRRNSLALSSIWSRITLSWMYEGEDYDRETAYEKLSSILDTFLNRSRQYPLTVSLELKTSRVPFLLSNGMFDPLVSRVFGQAHRWRSFSSGDSFHRAPRIFHCEIPSSLPVLEDVRFEGSYDSINQNIVGVAPKLKSLVIDWHMPKSIESCLENLSHLELRPDYNSLEMLFQNSPKLTSLKVYMNDGHYLAHPQNAYPKDIVPSLSTTLETLTLTPSSFLPQKATYSIFPFLNLPSLRTICLETSRNNNGSSWIEIDHFIAFITRSSFQLTTLHIGGLALSDSNLILILTHMPTLLDFMFTDTHVPPESSPITGHFIQTLHIHGPEDPESSTSTTQMQVLPRLHSLKLTLRAETFDDAAVIGMVQSRWKPIQSPQYRSWGRIISKADAKETLEIETEIVASCLRECIIRFPNRMCSELGQVYAELDDIEKDGMRLVVLGKDSSGVSGLTSGA